MRVRLAIRYDKELVWNMKLETALHSAGGRLAISFTKKKHLKVVRDLKLLPSAESGGLQALCSHILFPKRLYSGYSRSRALGTTNGVYMT